MLEKPLPFRLELLVCLLALTAILVVYAQVKNHPFINFDDDEYVVENASVRKGLTIGSVTHAFASVDAANWHPLTWLSHMLDVQLFGLNAGWHHLMNVFFHIANTVLLFLILNRMTRALWPSAFVAALFALHPLHVESVAWVAERKDVLSTFFWMLTLGAYAYYVEHPGKKRYLLTLAFFAMGLMAKPMLVTLPFVLLLLDYWPLGRMQTEPMVADKKKELAEAVDPGKQKRKKRKRETAESVPARKVAAAPQSLLSWTTLRPLVIEKIPFLTLSMLSSLVTLYAQQTGGAVKSLQVFPLDLRLMNALTSYVIYMEKTLCPVNLSVLYPYPETIPLWQVLGAAAVLALATSAVIPAARRFPYLTVGWLWYVGTLLPVIGIIQVGAQAMADRYTYVSSIGLFIVAAWGLPDLLQRWPWRKTVLIAGGSIMIALLMITTWKQVHYWRSDLSLFQQALTVTRNNDVAHAKVGFALAQMGHLGEARSHYENALRINPTAQGVHNQLGILLASQGKWEEAIIRFNEALALKPYNIIAHNNLGITFLSQGKFDQSLSHFKASLQIKPDDPEIQFLSGVALTRQGFLDGAIPYFREALRLNSNHARAHNDLGIALARKGNPGGAIFHFREALRVRPDFKEAQENLQSALARKGRIR